MKTQNPESIRRKQVLVIPMKTRNPTKKQSSKLPGLDSVRITTPEKLTDDYLGRIKSIYSPNTIAETTQTKYKVHSKIAAYKTKIDSSDHNEDSVFHETSKKPSLK